MAVVISPTLPIDPSPALNSVAAAALRERRLRLEAITQLEENFRARNDNLPNDNRNTAAVQASIFADTLPISGEDIFLAQLFSQQLLPGDSTEAAPLEIDTAALSQQGVVSAFGQNPYLNFFSAPITPYGVPVIQNFLV